MKTRLSTKTELTQLTAVTRVQVRFSETDALKMVWHGNHLKYFEDGRDEFGRKYDLDFLEMFEKEGFAAPIVKVEVNYTFPLQYGDHALVETTLVNTPAAKIIFDYKIYRASDYTLVARGETVQVFVTQENGLNLVIPEFFKKWKSKWELE